MLRALVEAQAPPMAAAAGAAACDAHRAALRGVRGEDHGAGHGPFSTKGGTPGVLGGSGDASVSRDKMGIYLDFTKKNGELIKKKWRFMVG